MNDDATSNTLDHERYMRRATERARIEPVALFQTVIVDRRTGEIVAEDANDAVGNHPLMHGETDAIDRCWRERPSIDWSRLALYTTAEPCAMCQAAIGWAGIGLVFYGGSTPFSHRSATIASARVPRRSPHMPPSTAAR